MKTPMFPMLRRLSVPATLMLAFQILPIMPVAAQENALGPPDVLQFPFEASTSASRSVPVQLLRAALETGADLALCEALMTEAGRPIPANFVSENCEPTFADKVRNGEGIVHWADGARPLGCGENCVGRPFMTRTQFVDRPNLRQAKLHGRLTFVADPPGPFNRDITYGFEAAFTCKAEDGARSGEFITSVKFGQPVIGDPGPIESVLDFIFLPADLSTRIENEIRKHLVTVPETSDTGQLCRSVGAFRGIAHDLDAAMFDPATAQPPGVRGLFASMSALQDRATIRFHRLTRKPLPANIDAGHARPGDPAAGFFNVFLNGKFVAFPALSLTPLGGIPLPPEGGSVNLNFCKTINLTDYDRLQLIFSNDLGGAAWSQFRRLGGFGGVAPHTITTGRTIVVPGGPGLPDPVTGLSTPNRPQAVVLREFELFYSINFLPRPDTVVGTGTASPVGPAGTVGTVGTLGDHAGVAIDPSAPAPVPCREI